MYITTKYMNILYYIASYMRILPRKAGQFFVNKYYGIANHNTNRMIQLPLTRKVWNHVENLYLEPTEILPGIYLGNAYNASNYRTIDKFNIKTIVNVSKELPNFFEKNTSIQYFQIPIKDDSENHLSEFIRPAIDFLDLNGPYDENNSVLIHCYMGSSRSASIVLLYLIYKYQYSYSSALELLRARRPIVNINTNFLKDIYDFYYEEPLII